MEILAKAFGAALSIGLATLATAWVQAYVGAAAAGVIAEKPELTGRMIFILVIPELLAILGFVVAVFILTVL